MEDASAVTETEEERKARLLAEAKTLKVPHDPSWSADKLEEAVAKKRTKAEPTAPNPLAAELADTKAKLKETAQALSETQQALASAEDMIVTLNKDNEAITARYNELAAKELEQFNRLSNVEVELFELKQKRDNNPDKVEESEDFMPKDQRAASERAVEQPKAAKPTASASAGTVRCVVTKHGHNQLFTGKEDGSRHPAKTVLDLPEAVARLQEEKGFVEIE